MSETVGYETFSCGKTLLPSGPHCRGPCPAARELSHQGAQGFFVAWMHCGTNSTDNVLQSNVPAVLRDLQAAELIALRDDPCPHLMPL